VKIILSLMFVLGMVCEGFAATYYIDKRTGLDTNDGLTVGTAWKTLTNPGLSAKVAAGGTHTINVVAGSGPYYPPDAMALSVGYVYHQQTTGNITWNWNGNAFQADWNANDPILYKWTATTDGAKTGWFYLTALAGTAPQQSAQVTVGATGAITELFSVIIGNEWNEKSTNLVNGAPNPRTLNNWAWGNYDALAFSTLYVKMANGLSPSDPSNSATPIMITNNNGYIVRMDSLTTTHNDLVVRGCNDSNSNRGLVILGKPTTINRAILINSRMNGIDTNNALATGSIIQNSVLSQCGHRAIQVSSTANITIDNNTFDRTHLALKFLSDTAYTVTMRNNATINLYAGGVQKDVATPTFVESNNQWHIDSLSTHGGKGITFTTGTAQWTTTAASDLPSSTSTALATSIDPLLDSNYKPSSNSPCINAGDKSIWYGSISATDAAGKAITDSKGNLIYRYNGTTLLDSVDIGAYQFISTKKRPQTCRATARFTPASAGTLTGALTASWTNQNDVVAALTGVGVAVGANDNFTYSDGALATVSGGKWVKPSWADNINVISGTVGIADNSTIAINYWNNTNLTNDHCSEMVLTTFGSGQAGVVTRVQAGANSYYQLASSDIRLIESGSVTNSSDTFTSPAGGDKIKLCSNGSTHKAYINDTLMTTWVNNTLPTGYAGIKVRYLDSRSDTWAGSVAP